jgi:predicted nucleotidyltransferase
MRRILDAALNASSKHLLDLRDNIGQDRMMDQSTIVARLREYERELKAAGIEHLLLHGSYARGTAIREASDVDVIADFDQAKRLSLIGRVHLENRLTDILGVKADLADRAMLRPEVLERAQHEAILVF